MCLVVTAWLRSKLVESHCLGLGFAAPLQKGPEGSCPALCSTNSTQTSAAASDFSSANKQGLVRFEGCSHQGMFALKNPSWDLCIRSVLPCCAAGQSHGEQPGLGAWRVGMRAEPPAWAALSAEIPGALQGSELLPCLPALLASPCSGQMLHVFYPGHHSAAALPRKLGRLGFIALGAVGVQGRSQPSPQIMMTEKEVYCVLTEISPPIFPSSARSSSSLAFIFLTQM